MCEPPAAAFELRSNCARPQTGVPSQLQWEWDSPPPIVVVPHRLPRSRDLERSSRSPSLCSACHTPLAAGPAGRTLLARSARNARLCSRFECDEVCAPTYGPDLGGQCWWCAASTDASTGCGCARFGRDPLGGRGRDRTAMGVAVVRLRRGRCCAGDQDEFPRRCAPTGHPGSGLPGRIVGDGHHLGRLGCEADQVLDRGFPATSKTASTGPPAAARTRETTPSPRAPGSPRSPAGSHGWPRSRRRSPSRLGRSPSARRSLPRRRRHRRRRSCRRP
jgi:hypothetical protein